MYRRLSYLNTILVAKVMIYTGIFVSIAEFFCKASFCILILKYIAEM